MPNAPQMGFKSSAENLLEDTKMPPPLPPLKPEWRTHMRTAQQLNGNGESEEQQEEAIPSDSLYGVGGGAPWRDTRPPPPQARPKPNLGDMSHWSSHGYLAKGGEEGPATPPHGNGYVVLKRQGDGMVTVRSPTNNSQQQPSSLPPITTENSGPAENKYFSVRGMRDMISKAGEVTEEVGQTQSQKYFSVDAKFLHQHADMKNKLRENLRVSQASQKEMPQQEVGGGGGGGAPNGFYQPPAPPPNLPPYQRPPPPAHLRPQQEPKPPVAVASHQNNLETTKAMSGSVSWLEWTQQLQAYIAWVNSQLRKRADLKPVQDLRSDLQSGEVLAQLIEIICE